MHFKDKTFSLSLFLMLLSVFPALTYGAGTVYMNKYYVAIEHEHKTDHWFLIHKAINTPSFLVRRCQEDRYECVNYRAMESRCNLLYRMKENPAYVYVCRKMRELRPRIFTLFGVYIQ